MQTVAQRATARLARANVSALRPVRGMTAVRKAPVLSRATADEAADAAAAAAEKAKAAAAAGYDRAKELSSAGLDKAKELSATGIDKAKEAATKLKGSINQATLDVDISSLLRYNFLAQVGLTAVSWFVVFTTSHAKLAQGGSVNPVALVLLVGVALAGYSAYLSFSYLRKSKAEGLGALDGWDQLNAFYEHANYNFLGAAAAIVALMASVGTLMMKSQSSFTLEALAQASGNVVLAHLVSLAFLSIMTRKIVQAYEKLATWSTEFKNSMSKLA
ncbi:MAG: hypothetical protein J3K34DRAFT_432213 [Monoraphidium minutum]|nr:MAG: hypothetical protein J3K34DRAFT_432213 [Monoraphidium minutum]